VAVPFIRCAACAVAVEDDSFHGCFAVDHFAPELIVISLVGGTGKVAREGTEPSRHVGPGEQHGDGDDLIGGIVGVYAIDSNRVDGLAVFVGNDR